MTAFFAKPAAKIGLCVLLLLALIGLVLWWRGSEKADDRTNQSIGAGKAVIEGQRQTLEQVKDANDAGNQVRDNRGSARYDACLQDIDPSYAGACERYKPNERLPD